MVLCSCIPCNRNANTSTLYISKGYNDVTMFIGHLTDEIKDNGKKTKAQGPSF